jgi:hypothetical protein
MDDFIYFWMNTCYFIHVLDISSTSIDVNSFSSQLYIALCVRLKEMENKSLVAFVDYHQ